MKALEQQYQFQYLELYHRLYANQMLDIGEYASHWSKEVYPRLKTHPPFFLYSCEFELIPLAKKLLTTTDGRESYFAFEKNKINIIVMKRILLALLFISHCSFAQVKDFFGIIKDNDGYVNIREKANIKSKIIGTLSNNTMVYIGEDPIGNWLKNEDNGYIYKDRVQWIHHFKAIPSVGGNEYLDIFSQDGIEVKVATQKFDKNKHEIIYTKKFGVTKIDGFDPYGVDYDLPKYEYKSIEVTINGKKVDFPKKAYSDLLDPLSAIKVYYDKDSDALYIVTTGGAGAAEYDVCWQIINGIYKDRKVGSF